MKKLIIDKMNEGQEPDVKKYNWDTIPSSLKVFWENKLNICLLN